MNNQLVIDIIHWLLTIINDLNQWLIKLQTFCNPFTDVNDCSLMSLISYVWLDYDEVNDNVT